MSKSLLWFLKWELKQSIHPIRWNCLNGKTMLLGTHPSKTGKLTLNIFVLFRSWISRGRSGWCIAGPGRAQRKTCTTTRARARRLRSSWTCSGSGCDSRAGRNTELSWTTRVREKHTHTHTLLHPDPLSGSHLVRGRLSEGHQCAT